jgi:hypothetical protein
MRLWLANLRWVTRAFTRRLSIRHHASALHSRQAAARGRLEQIRLAFVDGVSEALQQPEPDAALAARLRSAPNPRLRGFRFEGAGMGLRLRERFTPEKGLVAAFRAAGGEPYRYLVEVGAGWGAALPWASRRAVVEDEAVLLQWLRVDGFAFARALFRWSETETPDRLARMAEPFAQIAAAGVGRALFFRCAASCADIVEQIERWPMRWRPSLYAGCGLAAVYAGGAGAAELESLRRAAGGARPALAQGASFAAKARLAGGELSEDDAARCEGEEACQILTGLGLAEAAGVTDEALRDLPDVSSGEAYQLWRGRVQRALAQGASLAMALP